MIIGSIIAIISFALGNVSAFFILKNKKKTVEVKQEPKEDPYKQYRTSKGLLNYNKFKR